MSVQALTWVLEISESTLGDRLVLYSIANHCNHDGVDAYPSVASIARESRLSERQVQRSLQNLQVLGELEIYPNQGPKGTNYFVLAKMVRPRCWYCGADLFIERTIDHQTPVSKGGTDDLANLVYACLPCNASKGVRTLDEYRSSKQQGKFFGESEGRQYVTRPKQYTPTNRRPRVTNHPEEVSHLAPEPSKEPSLNRPEEKESPPALKFPKPEKKQKVRSWPQRPQVVRPERQVSDGPRQSVQGRYESSAERKLRETEAAFNEVFGGPRGKAS